MKWAVAMAVFALSRVAIAGDGPPDAVPAKTPDAARSAAAPPAALATTAQSSAIDPPATRLPVRTTTTLANAGLIVGGVGAFLVVTGALALHYAPPNDQARVHTGTAVLGVGAGTMALGFGLWVIGDSRAYANANAGSPISSIGVAYGTRF